VAVVVVGDFDEATVENLAQQHFDALPKPKAPRRSPGRHSARW
jgi:predicted Zn-dependent peptidase